MITITDKKRCRYIRLSASLFVACLLWGCSNDDSVVSPQQVNVNRNTATVQAFYTEPTTPASVKTSVVYGLEIPSLKTDMVDAFIAHTLPNGTLNYCIGYNTRLKANCWTAYKWYNGFSSKNTHWNRNKWKQGETFNGYGGSSDPFQPDPVLPESVRITSNDYKSSGYDRGHILGSADRLNSKEANGQTFYMSNMHPQLKAFNEMGGIWYNLENFVRAYDTSTFRDTLYVVKGGTISAGNYTMVGQNDNLVCPNYFYMAILGYTKSLPKTSNGYFAIAYWMEHKATQDVVSAKYTITIDELEKRTGIDFFCNLPDEIEDAVESRYYLSDWRLN